MAALLKIFGLSKDSDQDSSPASAPPTGGGKFTPPPYVEPETNKPLIFGQAEAAYKGEKTVDEGRQECADHHRQAIRAAQHDNAKQVSGEKARAEKALRKIQDDIHTLEKTIKGLVKHEIQEVARLNPLELSAKIKLTVAILGFLGLSGASFYANYTIIYTSAIAAGWAAIAMSVIPVGLGGVAEFTLQHKAIPEKTRQKLFMAYVLFAICGGLAWLLTMGHQAGSNDGGALLGSLQQTSQSGEDHSIRMMIRGIGQAFIEIFAVAITADQVWTIWTSGGRGSRIEKHLIDNPQYVREKEELDAACNIEQSLENVIAACTEWEKGLAPFEEQYASKAEGLFDQFLNALRGK